MASQTRQAMSSDDQLILEFQKGSPEAFRELFERYRDPIYGFFRRRLNNPARAEERAQECFLAILRTAAQYEPRAGFRSYLYGIAIKMVSAERRKAGRQLQQTDGLDGAADDASSGAGLWVREALEQLEKRDREILMLREYEQLSYTEIAAPLRVPFNTVRSRFISRPHGSEGKAHARARRS